MAVKKRQIVHENRNQLNLTALVQYIQLMNEQPNYLPPHNELVKHCQDIVKCLARTRGDEDELWELLQSVEEFLVRLVDKVHNDNRRELITAILDKFYFYTSDPQSDACPATSVVLVVLDQSNPDAAKCAARWVVQQDSGPAGAGLRATLSCLFRWLYEWNGTPSLGGWVLAFIKALEANERFNILIEVSIENLSRLFLSLNDPLSLRESVAGVIIHIMSSLRESSEALDRLSPHVGRVLVSLAADSDQWSRHLLQNVVDILTAMVDHQIEILGYEAKEKYADVLNCLESHMTTSRGNRKMLTLSWRSTVVPVTTNVQFIRKKVGLVNLGNTCYMNSVVQALLVTRQFSTHVMLKMNNLAYWAKMAELFANMTHSINNHIAPKVFFNVMRPPFFSKDQQHDSSEFLGYLFELLQSYENSSDLNFDYTRTAVLRSPGVMTRLRAITQAGNSSSESDGDATPNRRSMSPRPGSSAAGSSSGSKRASMEPESHGRLKKRLRKSEPAMLTRDSYIDHMFGGVLLTRLECTACHSSSLSRDVFRDLQLAFPDVKPENWENSVQHLLEYYCSKEYLTGVNKYACRDCGVLRDAERSVVIETPPKYLILVLKNFKFDPKLKVQTKLMQSGMLHNTTVVLPTVRAQARHSTYTIYAAVVHSGTTLDSGHYYTIAKENNKWYVYNDEVVAEDPEKGHLGKLGRGSTPYILFYRRTDIDEGILPTLDDLPSRLQEAVMSHNKECVENLRMVLRNRN